KVAWRPDDLKCALSRPLVVTSAIERNRGLMSGNRLKLGLFGSNCSSGRSYTRVPERWVAAWENNLKLAQLAERYKLECMVPIHDGKATVARQTSMGPALNR